MIRRRGDGLGLLLLSMAFTVGGVAVAVATMSFGRSGATRALVAEPESAPAPEPVRPAMNAKGVPRLASGGVPALQSDPRAADYDALRLTQLAIPAREIFESEPRDERWAPVIERRITRSVDDDLASALSGARVAGIECHTMVCRLELAADDRATLRQASMLFQYAPRAPRMDHVGSKGLKTTVYMTFDRETRDPEAHEKWYQAVRELSLRKARAGTRRPSDPPVPAS
jgi:hypothetical protein